MRYEVAMPMNLDRFMSGYTCTLAEPNGSSQVGFKDLPELEFVLEKLGGRTFSHGLYRVLRQDQVERTREVLVREFPEYQGRILPFGFDWLGRHFALDLERMANGRPLVLMLEVGAGEAMLVPTNLLDFHNIELVDFPHESLALEFWTSWRANNPEELAFTNCVGYRIPLFLGGSDDLNNLEVVDVDAYLEVCAQLRGQTRTLRAGESVRGIRFDE